MTAFGIPSIGPLEAAQRLEAGAADGAGAPLVVDVRNPDEFAADRIAGAVLVPLPEFAARFRELPADRPLFLVCHSGSRSAAATAHLVRNGYPLAVNLVGGMLAWSAARLPIRTGPPAPGEGDLAS